MNVPLEFAADRQTSAKDACGKTVNKTYRVVVPGKTACSVGLMTSHCAKADVYAYGDVEHCTLSPSVKLLSEDEDPLLAETAAAQAASEVHRLQSRPVKPDAH